MEAPEMFHARQPLSGSAHTKKLRALTAPAALLSAPAPARSGGVIGGGSMRVRAGRPRGPGVVVLFLVVLAFTGLGGTSARADDAEIEQEAKAIVDLFGGVYDDPKLAQYIAGVGTRLVQTTPMAKQPFTFTVLDSPAVNAFSLPGGHVFVTRGLLALVGNEAELAGVLGHEIGHITAHHAQSRERRAALPRPRGRPLPLFRAPPPPPGSGHLLHRLARVGGPSYVGRFS